MRARPIKQVSSCHPRTQTRADAAASSTSHMHTPQCCSDDARMLFMHCYKHGSTERHTPPIWPSPSPQPIHLRPGQVAHEPCIGLHDRSMYGPPLQQPCSAQWGPCRQCLQPRRTLCNSWGGAPARRKVQALARCGHVAAAAMTPRLLATPNPQPGCSSSSSCVQFTCPGSWPP